MNSVPLSEISHAAGENSADLAGSERVRRHPHRRARSPSESFCVPGSVPGDRSSASERTVKYWLSGERGPSGEHLVSLSRQSDAVLIVLLSLADRLVLGDGEE